MAKEQLAVIEMITNMILGKTNGVSKVDFTPQKIPFPENLPYEQAFLRATPEPGCLFRETDTFTK